MSGRGVRTAPDSGPGSPTRARRDAGWRPRCVAEFSRTRCAQPITVWPCVATLGRAGASSIAVTSHFCIDIPARLIARIQCGELAAFDQVYRLFERPAWTLALRMIGNPEDAREVVHDAMLRVFDRARQFRGDSPFWGWVRRIVVNEALMRLRRDRAHVGQAYDETEHAHEADTSTPAPWVWTEARQLESALEALPALTRSVIWLYHVEGHTHPEIAEMTGKSISFSKSQLARGTARLRELLGTSTAEDPCSPTLMATP